MTPTFTAADRQRVFERILIDLERQCAADRPARVARQRVIDGMKGEKA